MSKLVVGKKAYPYYVNSIIDYGVDKWVDGFQPILNPVVFQDIYNMIFLSFQNIMSEFNEKSPEFWSGVVHYKMPRDLALRYFRFLEIRQLAENGYTHICLGNGEERSLEREFCIIEENVKKVVFRHNISASERFKEILRLMKINLSSCGIKKFLTCLTPNYECCVIADPDDLYVKAYCLENDLSPMCLRSALFLSSETPIEKQINGGNEFIQVFFDDIFSRIPESKEFFNSSVVNYYKKLFSLTIYNFKKIRRKLRNKKLGVLLLESMTNAECRLPAAVWKSLGGRVVGFAHGNAYLTCIGGSDETNGAHLVLTDFVVGSKGEELNLKYLRRLTPSTLNGDDRIIYLQYDLYKELRSKRGKIDFEKGIVKKIMIVGFPLDSFYYPGLPGHDALKYTHLTLRIIKDLKGVGYEVVYKAHPDTLKESEGIFEGVADLVISESFEKVYNSADCILFPSPYSTTFGFTVLTDKPVVYMRNGDWNYEPERLTENLHKRVVPVSVKMNMDAVLEYDAEELKEAVGLSLTRMDFAAVEQFAF